MSNTTNLATFPQVLDIPCIFPPQASPKIVTSSSLSITIEFNNGYIEYDYGDLVVKIGDNIKSYNAVDKTNENYIEVTESKVKEWMQKANNYRKQ